MPSLLELAKSSPLLSSILYPKPKIDHEALARESLHIFRVAVPERNDSFKAQDEEDFDSEEFDEESYAEFDTDSSESQHSEFYFSSSTVPTGL